MTDPIYIPIRPTYPDDPAFAQYGLTKREYFAALFMQTRIQKDCSAPTEGDYNIAIIRANKLINALNRNLNHEPQPTNRKY